MSCRCEDINVTVPVRSLAELQNVMSVVRVRINDGTLVEDLTHRDGPSSAGFDALVASAPYPDHISHNFKCSDCGRRFALSVETYHGAGGSWKPVSALPQSDL